MTAVKITFWGTRGSIPTPSTANFLTRRFGGNTACLSVRIPGQLLILDAGSGLRNLGLELAATVAAPLRASFFFSHCHWDHLQGFPFFPPCFDARNTFELYAGPADAGNASGGALERTLRAQQQSLPVPLAEMGATLNFHEMQDGASVELPGTAGKLLVTSGALHHPGGCRGYRIEAHTRAGIKALVFATDTEHQAQNSPNLQRLARDADLLVYDAQYTVEEYEGRQGVARRNWGHSTWFHGLREAREARVKRLVLFHHDPQHDDWAVARIENEARQEGRKWGLEVDAAYEGLEIELLTEAVRE